MDQVNGTKMLFKRIVNRVARPFGINPFPRAFENVVGNNSTKRKDVFDTIYRSNLWASDESRSGIGSELQFSGAYLARLQALLKERHFSRLFDAPCGDLNWAIGLAKDPGLSYQGGDISESLITDLRDRHPDLNLGMFDICSDAFPEADVWHCRDCLFHLPFSDIRRALENFTRSSIPFALLTTHRARWLHRNLDVTVGGFRFLDLERPPFALPKPELYLDDYRKGTEFPRFVALWSRQSIARAIGARV